MSSQSDGEISILHVDDERDLGDLASLYLERENEQFTVVTESTVESALETLAETEIDCIVSDYDMPGMNGLEFLERVRATHPSLPFILFTGKGSEEIASEAISAGVTDYLQKEIGSDQYTVLANRIENTVAQSRAEKEIETMNRWYSTILEHSSDYVMIVDPMGKVDYISPAVERVLGFSPTELEGDDSFGHIHPDDLEGAVGTLSEVIELPGEERTVEFRSRHANGSWRWLEVRGRSLLNDPIINGIMVNVRDITDRKEREHALELQKQQLQDLTRFMSHDVQNQLTIISGRLGLIRAEYEGDDLDSAAAAVQRVSEMIDRWLEFAQAVQLPDETVSVSLESAAKRSWRNVSQADATLEVESTATIEANEERFRALLENLFINAIEHGGQAVTIRVGQLSDGSGFYVEDDGSGIPASERDQVLDSGYSTDSNRSGLGLTIVKQIVESHGWTIAVTESSTGGARFAIRTD